MAQSVEQAIGRDRVRKALKRYENRPSDRHTSGLVREVNADGSFEVLLPNAVQTTRCSCFCSASVGDVVEVVMKADGKCDAIGRLGGAYAFGWTDGWYWERHPSGRALCKKRVSVAVTAWNKWGELYESAESIGPQAYPVEFAEAPSFSAQFATADTPAFLTGFGVRADGSAVETPPVYLLRGTALSGDSAFQVDLVADGFWKVPEVGGTSVLGAAVLGEMVLGRE